MIYINKYFLIFFITTLIVGQHIKLIGPPGGSVRNDQIVIHPVKSNNIYSSTWSGALFHSDDFGNSNKPIEVNFGNISVTWIYPNKFDINNLFIYSYHILKSIDAGESWKIFEENAFRKDFLIHPLNKNTIFLTRNDKELWRSNNYGESWTHIYTFDNRIYKIKISENDTSKFYLSTSSRNLYRSTNSGKDWELRNTENVFRGDPRQIEISPYNDNTVYVRAGGIYKSNDGGKTFSVHLEVINLSAFAVNPLDTLTMYAAVGDNVFAPDGGIIKTTNEGEEWYPIMEGIEGEFVTGNSLKMNPHNPEELYAGIGSLGIYKTTNGGRNWFLTNAAYSDVSAIYVDKENPGTILTGQYGWAIMKTENFGDDWHHPEFNTPFQRLPILEIDFNPFNLNEGYAASEYGLFKTTDRGESWVYSTNMEKMQTVSYHPEVEGLIFASSVESDFFEGGIDAVYKSTDGGESWKIVSTQRIIQFDYDKNDPNIVYALGRKYSILYRSTDQGESWDIIFGENELENFPYAEGKVLRVSGSNPNNIYLGFRDTFDDKREGMIFYSSDGGENWTRIESKLNELDNGGHVATIWLDELQSGRMYVGTYSFGQPLTDNFSNGGLYLTEDNGNSWRKVYGSAVNVIKADNETPRNMYIGTKFGVKTFLDTLTVTSVRNDEEEILPSEYALFQNFPNPFNPSTQIKYAIPNGTNVKLKVFDILGKEIITLVNGYKNAGTYEVQFDASNLPSGVYLYRLETESFSQTKKLMLIK